MTLTPDGTVGATSGEWDANTGTREDAVATDNGDTSYISEDTDGNEIIFTLSDPPVSEASIATIDSVEIFFKGRYASRSGTSSVSITLVAVPATHTTDNVSISSGLAYSTYSGSTYTTNSAGSDWTYANITNMRLKLSKLGTTAYSVRITYIYANVIYTLSPVTGNAIFFGHNF